MKRVITILAFVLLVFANDVKIEAKSFDDKTSTEFVVTQFQAYEVTPVLFTVEEIVDILEVENIGLADPLILKFYADRYNYRQRKSVNLTTCYTVNAEARAPPRLKYVPRLSVLT